MFNPKEHLMDLKGKSYLQVMWRLVWFREDKPLWCIDTKLEQLTDNHAVFSAKIYDENGVQKSAGYGSESVKDFRDFIEKAETKAVGRALAMLGYGTQFSPEMDEGERIADSPVSNTAFPPVCECCGKTVKKVMYQGDEMSAADFAKYTKAQYGRVLCVRCMSDVEAGK